MREPNDCGSTKLRGNCGVASEEQSAALDGKDGGSAPAPAAEEAAEEEADEVRALHFPSFPRFSA